MIITFGDDTSITSIVEIDSSLEELKREYFGDKIIKVFKRTSTLTGEQVHNYIIIGINKGLYRNIISASDYNIGDTFKDKSKHGMVVTNYEVVEMLERDFYEEVGYMPYEFSTYVSEHPKVCENTEIECVRIGY